MSRCWLEVASRCRAARSGDAAPAPACCCCCCCPSSAAAFLQTESQSSFSATAAVAASTRQQLRPWVSFLTADLPPCRPAGCCYREKIFPSVCLWTRERALPLMFLVECSKTSPRSSVKLRSHLSTGMCARIIYHAMNACFHLRIYIGLQHISHTLP